MLKSITRVTGTLAVALIAALVADASGRQAQRGVTPLPVLEWETLTEQQFRQLADSQPIMFSGRRATLGEVRALVESRRKAVGIAQQAKVQPLAARSANDGRASASVDRMLRQQSQQIASATAKIQSGLTRLRQQKGALAPVTPPQAATPYNTHGPKITNVFAILQPGGAVLIDGGQFGSAPGRVRLIAKDNSWELELEKLEWFPSGIGGLLPKKAGGVTVLPAKFVVEIASGVKSNEWPVNWIMDIKVLPSEDVAVEFCSTESNYDTCNNESSGQDFCAKAVHAPSLAGAFVNKEGASSFGGLHENCWGSWGNDKDTDRYRISLKNGWVLYDVEFRTAINGSTLGHANIQSSFPAGATEWNPAVEWLVRPTGGLVYSAKIFIKGPKGVPHK